MSQPAHIEDLQKFVSEHDGKPLNQEHLQHPNQMVAKVLIARLLAMSPEEKQTIKSLVTPETSGALAKLVPELSSMIQGITNG